MHLHPYYVLRRPLLPIDVYFDVQARLRQGHALPDVLRDCYQQPLVVQALYFASADVFRQCQQWLSGTLQPSDKLFRTLYRYLIRMSTRATPFGLCSGISVGEWGEQSRVSFATNPSVRTNLRLDALAMQQILQYTSGLPTVQPTVQYRANDTAYVVGHDLRYIEAVRQGALPGSYSLSATDNNPYLEHLLAVAQTGVRAQALIEVLVREGIDATDAEDFVGHLIENQLLLSEFSPTLTAHNELPRLIGRLAQLPDQQSLTELLTDVDTTLRQARTTPEPSTNVAHCLRLEERLAPLIDIENRPLVQCDSYFPTSQNTIGHAVQDTLQKTLRALLPLSQATEAPSLRTFRERFYDRYEEQEIPLLLALDPDLGIGYEGSSLTSPLLDGFEWPNKASGSLPFTTRDKVLLRLLSEALRTGQAVLSLTDADLTALTEGQPDATLPSSGSWVGHLLAESAEALDNTATGQTTNWLFHLIAAGGPSAGNMLGRMAHLDPALEAHLQASLREEEASDPDALWAEIVHLPEAKLANVLTRPVLRHYEIPLLTGSGVPENQQIPLDDLLVSVPRGERIILRSKRLGKRVIPRLSTAHNYAQGLAHYRFLCDLQMQEGSVRVSWNWGVLASQPHLPQVRYRNVILSRATWQLSKTDFPPNQPDWLAIWRERYNVPRYVVLVDADNELPLDLANELNASLLADELARHKTITVKEWLLGPQTCWAGSGSHRWVGELILPATFSTATTTPLLTTRSVSSPIQRSFAPGSEWTYLKIFSGEQANEQLLINELPGLLDDLRLAECLKQWFYIRYNHPEPQLRLRFQSHPGEANRLLTNVLAWVQQLTDANGTLYRVQLDTYHRELERYGPNRIELCEMWFYRESDLMLPILQLISQQGETERLFHACALVHRLLNVWDVPIEQRETLMSHFCESFGQEFGADTALLVQLDKSYRQHRQLVHAALTLTTPEPLPGLADYEPTFAELVEQLRATLTDQTQRDALLTPLIHMLLNRVYRSENRRHEYLTYHLLRKEYTSIRKRFK